MRDRRFPAVVVLGLLAACDARPRPTPQGYLFEKGPYQGFYAPNGKLIRLLYDEDGDKKADVVMLLHPNGKVSQAEIDANHDGIVDRWQYFAEDGRLLKEGYARRKRDTPDLWEYRDKAGNVERREMDEDGDAQIDRVETLESGRLVSVGIDGDRNGKMERWQTWAGGRMAREELDLDADGIPDRRLRYGRGGGLAGMDVLNAAYSRQKAKPDS